jgi:uncharacterized glyoxalase superfamily protein PhnB
MKVKSSTLIVATKDNDEAMGKFYQEMLGFKKNAAGGYERGKIAVFFDRHDKAAPQALEPFRIMITFEVDDIQKAYQELKGKGVKFIRRPEAEEWGGKFATFTDPDGNYLQIFQR